MTSSWFFLSTLHKISFLAVVKPVVIFTAGTHRCRRPLSDFFAHLAAAVAPTLPVVQAHGLHAAAIAITTRPTACGATACKHATAIAITTRPTACGATACTYDTDTI